MEGDRKFIYHAKACYFALQNNQQEAIANLKEVMAIDPLQCRLEAQINPDFKYLQDNPEFKALINN